MTSEARIAANRRNAEKSTGPKTTIGKAVVAQNAIKHGLFAHQDVIAEEDPQQYQEHRQRLLGELSPASEMETILAGRIVSLTWRLKRAETLQNELFDYLLAKELENSIGRFFDQVTEKDQEDMRRYVDTDPAYAVGRMIAKDYRGEKMLDRLGMHERRIEGSLYRTMHELHRRQLRWKADGGQCPPYKSEPGDKGSDCAKQSQLATEECGTFLPRVAPPNSFDGADSIGPEPPMPHGQTSLPVPPGECAKQSQSEEVSSLKSVETQDFASPQGIATSSRCCAEQSQSASDVPCETKPIDPAGATCSGLVGVSAETQNLASLQEGVAANGTSPAKQSQCPRPAPGAKGVLRPRPRVAWHCHNT